MSTERRLTKAEPKGRAQQLRTLSRRLVDVQEEERRRLTRELHDRVGPSLTALNIILNRMAGDLPKRAPDKTRRDLRESLDLVEATAESIENVMLELRTPMLDQLGLLATLRWYAELFTRRTGIPAIVSGEEPARRLDQDAGVALFRIAQEALTNVARHARAKCARIGLHQERGTLTLAVADDGVGFATTPVLRGVPRCGISGMRERALAVGGVLQIESSPGAGTRVTVELRQAV